MRGSAVKGQEGGGWVAQYTDDPGLMSGRLQATYWIDESESRRRDLRFDLRPRGPSEHLVEVAGCVLWAEISVKKGPREGGCAVCSSAGREEGEGEDGWVGGWGPRGRGRRARVSDSFLLSTTSLVSRLRQVHGQTAHRLQRALRHLRSLEQIPPRPKPASLVPAQCSIPPSVDEC